MSIASLYPSINPSLLLDFANSKVLDPRITFTRTTTATYYDGVTTAKAEENLLTYSQEFDNAAWSKANITVSANATTAPDGTSTADLVYPSSSTTNCAIYQFPATTASVTITASFYVKANSWQWVAFRNFNGSGTGVWFDLTNVVTGTDQLGYTVSITNVGNNWRRIVITGTSFASSYFIVMPTDSNGSFQSTPSGTNGIYIWGAQLEQRSSATAYTATTTQAITNYIPVLQTASAGQARFDHNPTTGESLGLLIEEARTNKCLRSEEFGTSPWATGNASITPNTIVAPDGNLTGDKFVEDAVASTDHAVVQSVTVTAGANTFSVYVKAAGRTKFQLREGSNGATADYDLASPSSGMTDVGNGWYRCVLTATPASTTFIAQIYLKDNSGNNVYIGNGFSGLYLWGGQLEAGSFATSYIPTVASTVTRNADAASMTGTNFSSWFSPSAGTMYVDANVFGLGAPSNESYFLGADNASSSDRFNFHMRSSTINTQIGTSGSGYPGAIISGSYVGVSVKVASAYATGNFGASVNSGTVATNTSALQPWSPPNIGIGYAVNASNGFLNGRIKKIAYYPIRVTNAQLQALTV